MGWVERSEDLKKLEVWVNSNRRGSGDSIPDLPFSEAEAIYKMLKKKIEDKLWTSEVNQHWIRLSIEWIHSMLFGEYGLTMDALIGRTKSGLGNYLEWHESAFGKAVDKLGKTIVDEWVLSKYSSVAKQVIDKAEGGNLRAADLMFKTAGKADGNPLASSQAIVEWIRSYGVFENGKKEESIKISVPTKNLLEGQDGKTI